MENTKMKLGVASFGMALGVTWGLGMLLMGIVAWQTGWGLDFLNIMSSVYIGYAATLGGSIVGAIWGFFDALIAGIVIAFLYNLFNRGCPKKAAE